MNAETFADRIHSILGAAPSPAEITPGKLLRFPTGDRRDNDAGWCRLFEDGEGGVFGCWRQGVKDTWQAREPATDDERQAFRNKVQKAQEEARKQEEERRVICREESSKLLKDAPLADPSHRYLVKKGIRPNGTRQSGDKIIIPVRDSSGVLQGLQFIDAGGNKKFKSGTAVSGCYFSIGKPNGTLLICEGFATGATLHEITGHAVACAFNAGNLKPAAEALRAKLPDVEIILCADNDRKPGNVGLTKATEAARTIRGKVAVPIFSNAESEGTDFNDLCADEGAETVLSCISDAMTPNIAPPPENSLQCEPEGDSKPSRIRVVSAVDFMGIDFPPRVNLLSPWLPKQGLAMVYAPRGIGKTHFSLGVAYAVASGGQFFTWKATAPRGVMFLDGEMPGAVLQERLARIAISGEEELAAPLHIISPDLQPSTGMIDLSRREDQQELAPYLEGVELIIVDNLSTLCRSGKENEGEGWLPVQEWALQQRAAGRSVLFIHHAGKNGEQRGTSRREDVLDTVIALKRPGDYTPDKGACFEIHFEKARGIFGDDTKPFEAQLVVTPDDRQTWIMKSLENSTAEKVAGLLNEGVPQSEIPDMLGVSKGTVSKAKKKAGELGLLR